MFSRLTKIADLTPELLGMLIKKAFEFKEKYDAGTRREDILKGKVVAMLFEKPSLRTRVAFEVATHYLGGTPIFLESKHVLARGKEAGRESIPDITHNLERFADLIAARVYSHDTITAITSATDKPVINLLCDKHHPTQALADLMVMKWHKKELKGLKVAFIGDGNNVAVSLMQACAMSGVNFSIASPEGYEIPAAELALAQEWAKKTQATIELERDPLVAVNNADVIYTDTFISMGEEDIKETKIKAFAEYQVNATLLKQAKPDVLFMHCLPAHRGEEVTDEVMDGTHSIIFDQAECRMHIAKSLIATMLKENEENKEDEREHRRARAAHISSTRHFSAHSVDT